MRTWIARVALAAMAVTLSFSAANANREVRVVADAASAALFDRCSGRYAYTPRLSTARFQKVAVRRLCRGVGEFPDVLFISRRLTAAEIRVCGSNGVGVASFRSRTGRYIYVKRAHFGVIPDLRAFVENCQR